MPINIAGFPFLPCYTLHSDGAGEPDKAKKLANVVLYEMILGSNMYLHWQSLVDTQKTATDTNLIRVQKIFV